VAMSYHRIPAWQGLAGPSVGHPAQPPPKQGHPEQGAQHRVQVGLEYLQRRRLYCHEGQSFGTVLSSTFTVIPSSVLRVRLCSLFLG